MKVMPAAEVAAFLAPIAQEVGVEIVEAVWDLRSRSLTLYIDKEGGMDLDTCAKFHNAVDGPLDELDPTFGQPYTLNCSSPGLDRPFKTEADFLRHVGEQIEIRFYAPFEGKKELVGTLLGFDGETIRLSAADGEKEIPFRKTAKVCLYIEV